ncbi:MAG: DUF4912 domain-containing protein [Deltaproteobacteria bacterium]
MKTKSGKGAAKARKPAAKKVVLPRRRVTGPAKSLLKKVQEIPLQETRVVEAKFYTGAGVAAYQRPAKIPIEQRALPEGYDEDVCVLQVRDPWWAHVYWDLRFKTWDACRSRYGADFEKSRWILRAYDISFIKFDGTNAHRSFDTSIDVKARNWYLNLGAPGTSWCLDLGFVLPDGRFIALVRSNVAALPLDGPSWMTDEEWMIPDDAFRRLYGMSVGLGPNVSSPVGKLWQERLKRDVSSGAVTSMVSSPVGRKGEKLPFWLVVDCELIVYGATEPDARVTVQGKPITLRKDGTFTLRYALPDGRQDIPVVARSAKIDETRTITPIVTRKTTRNP